MDHRAYIGALPVDEQMHSRFRGGVEASCQHPALQVAYYQHIRGQPALAYTGRGDEYLVFPNPNGNIAVVANHIAPLIEQQAHLTQSFPVLFHSPISHVLQIKILLSARRAAYRSSSSCWW